ncbi:CBS domain-containing protein [Thermosynechococcus vestitus]|uniref:Tll0519 protein n=1 Tax=Thermosynechococcus vestitus (strain NIES-2133 / IAM M-273 / BP-1) TaxID=197221 RepID=Q8DLH3_THEVB|nr:CBS domain-containing protein [Thermosynechococcus vestitus]BAC08071.1 tll0519 [Thermosynechococcus vestitus BP-1]
MDVVLCHQIADFDTLGAAVGLTRLYPGTKIVLTGGTHPKVGEFLAYHRDEYPLLEARAVDPSQLRQIWVVDTQWRRQLGQAAAWLDQPQVQIGLYDHHLEMRGDIVSQQQWLAPVGATSTLICEQLQAAEISLRPTEATVLALGIHADTGSLTFEQTTVRDVQALAWLLSQGANQRAIATYCEEGLSENLQPLLRQAWANLQQVVHQGYRLGWVLLRTAEYLPGLSRLITQLADLSECDAILLGHAYRQHHLAIIARSHIPNVNVAHLLAPLGGGGHAQAAAVTVSTEAPEALLQELLTRLREQIPHPPTAAELMSSPVRTVRPETPIADAHRVLLRYGHSGLSVVSAEGELLGIISRRDLDVALHHGFAHAPVKGYMKAPVRTISPTTPLPEIQALMVQYDIGRLPVVNDQGDLVGIVTRTDVLRHLYALNRDRETVCPLPTLNLYEALQQRLPEQLWTLLQRASAIARERGWQLYLVGGAVRDLLLAIAQGNHHLPTREFDLVVDGVQQEEAAGVHLAQALHALYPETDLQIYGQFQTAALHWPKASPLAGFAVDIATARSEFYPYPAAHPEVAASSIRQDLYRRDFTINALAMRLTPPRHGEVLDFFGGQEDLERGLIRVLHPNSFIEDPTRIFRAVRFAVRLGFEVEPQSRQYIEYALTSGVFVTRDRPTSKRPSLQSRLRNELRHLLELPLAPNEHFGGERALTLLAELGALECLDRQVTFDEGAKVRLQLVWQWWPEIPERREWQTFPLWELELLALIVTVPTAGAIARQLQLGEHLCEWLDTFPQFQQEWQTLRQTTPQRSHYWAFLESHPLPLIVLLAAVLQAEGRAPALAEVTLLREYLWQWRVQKLPLNGHDLQQLGYPRGPQLRQILLALRSAMLDGLVSDRPSAIAYVEAHFPKP